VDQNDDVISKSAVKAMEDEPLGEADDDVDMLKSFGAKSAGRGRGR